MLAYSPTLRDRTRRPHRDKSVLMMWNHGLTAAGPDVPSAFEELYLFERACRTLMPAYGSDQPLNVMSDKVATTVARGWLTCRETAYTISAR